MSNVSVSPGPSGPIAVRIASISQLFNSLDPFPFQERDLDKNAEEFIVGYLPKDKILFMSEAYLNRIFPAMRSAYPSDWVATIEKAQAMDVSVFVPGHGFVDSPAVLKEELETFRKAIVQVIAEARRLREAGLDAQAAVAQAKFGDLESWTLRASQGPIAIPRVFLELEGKLR